MPDDDQTIVDVPSCLPCALGEGEPCEGGACQCAHCKPLAAPQPHHATVNHVCYRCESTPRRPSTVTSPCEWCGRAIQPLDGMWHATKGAERRYDPVVCDASDDSRHHPPRPVASGSYGLFDPSNYVTFEEDT